MDERLRALNRFGLGARAGERDTLDDPRKWVLEQLEGRHALLPASAGLASEAELTDALTEQRRVRQIADRRARAAAQRGIRELLLREASVALTQRVLSETPFVERLVAFWSNHFCVSAQAAPPVRFLAGHYERTVVRPHVLGRFEDMLLASARHPAMLIYLDNARSVGPQSRAARAGGRRGRRVGLNENYARELLELHTVGVDGGYTQEDVEQLARVLTGWTVDGLGGRMSAADAPRFIFRPPLHEPGTKTVMGRRYREDGEQEGIAAIRDLARHPSTARFVSFKLARHFVGDDPPPSAVDGLGRVFRDSEGDLLEVARAVATLDEAWESAEGKFRTPQDWLVAVLRAVRAPQVPPQLLNVLQALRHPLWAPQAPKGFDDLARAWADPDSLMKRAELARSLSRRVAESRIDPAPLGDVVDGDAGAPLRQMLSDQSIPRDERVALVFASPAFQWR